MSRLQVSHIVYFLIYSYPLRKIQIQMETMNQAIIYLLQQSYTSCDTQTVKAVTQQLFAYAPIEGFLPALVEISTSTTTDHNLTIAALSQLKNCVRRFWKNNQAYEKICLSENDKQYLRNNIIALNIALSDNDKYGKIIKDIITNIGDSLYENIDQVITMLCNGEELRTCLNFLLGTVDFFRYHQYYEEDFRQRLKGFVCLSVPSLTKLIIEAQKQLNNLYEAMQANPTEEMVQNYNNQSTFLEQIMYLSIKFMAKIIEKEIPFQIREYVFQWGEVCLNRLNDTNESMHERIRQEENTFWPKRSEVFIYFHSRKWAIEYLYRFLNRILVYKKSQPLISQQTKYFYDTHLNTLTSIIKNLFMHFETGKIRVRQLKLLQKLFANKPKHMKEFLPFYLFQILPNYIYFDQQDYNLANNPVEYLGYEGEAEDRVYQSDNLRAIAAGLWVELTKEYAQRQQQKENIQILSLSLQYISRLIQSNQKTHQLAGVYLMQKLSAKIKMQETEVIISAMAQLTNFILQHFLRCQDFLLQSKTLEVFIKNNKIISYPVRKYVLEFLMSVLDKQVLTHTPQLIKINAILAMQMFQREELAMIDQLKIQDLIEIYLDMIIIYELENITVSFRLFMDRLRERAMPHALFVIQQLGQIIKTINLKPHYFQNNRFQIFKITNKNGVWSAAIQTLSVLCQLIDSQTVGLRAAIEEQLQRLLSMYFSIDLEEENPLAELGFVIFSFLHNYLEMIKQNRFQLPKFIEFYFKVLVFKMSKLPQMFLVQTQQKQQYSPQQIKMLESCCNHQQYMIFDFFKAMKLLMSFLKVELPMKGINEIRANLLKSNELEIFFHMIFSHYQKRSSAPDYFEMLEEYKGRILATILLIYFVEQHYQKMTPAHYHNILSILKLNQRKVQTKKQVSRYSRQLFYIWFWAFCPKYLIEKNQQYKSNITRHVISVLQSITADELKTTFFEQKRRTLLGYCSLLLATIFIPQIKVYQDNVIGMLFAIMKKILCYTGVLAKEDYEEQTLQTIRNSYQIRRNINEQPTSEEPYSDEPNYLIELPYENKDQFELLHQELGSDFDPQSIYDAEYQSKLDTTITNEFLPFFECLKNFQKYDPQGYRLKIHQTQYGVLLNEMMEANERSSNVYKLYQNIMSNSQEFNA